MLLPRKLSMLFRIFFFLVQWTHTGLADDDHTQYVLADGSRDIASDTDLSFNVGRLAIGSPTTDEMTISHFDKMAAGDFALKQTSSGVTTINSDANEQLRLSQNGTTRAYINSTGNFYTSFNHIVIEVTLLHS